MDVGESRRFLKAVAALMLLSLSACGEVTSGNENKTNNDKQEKACSSTAIANRYIVRWKDGTITSERAENEAAFRDQLQAVADQVDIIENDRKIQLIQPQPLPLPQEKLDAMLAGAPAPTPAPADWGRSRVGAANVWAQEVEGAGVTVAVIDSGMDTSHPDLAANLFVNAGETGIDSQGKDKRTNYVDDDKNGYVDDVSGFDFYNEVGMVTDGSGHGTHVAGVIAADGAAGQMKGVAPKAKILPLRFMDDDGSGDLSAAIRAIRYAADSGAKVINASWGGAPCSSTLKAEIAELAARNVLFLAASGNGDGAGRGVNLDYNPGYPAAYVLASQLTIGASTPEDWTAGFSNYSRTLVHLVAPGLDVFSTWPARLKFHCGDGKNVDGYCRLQGTSMATPFVSGAAALLWSARPYATVAQVRAALLAGIDAGPYEVSTRGRLNVRKSLEYLKSSNR